MSNIVSNKSTPELRLVKHFHVFVSALLFFTAWMIFRYRGYTFGFDRKIRYDFYIAFAYMILLTWFDGTFNAFTLGYFRIRDLCISQFLAQSFSIVIMYVAVSVAWFKIKNPLIFIPMLVLQGLFDMLWSYVGTKYYYKRALRYNTAVIYREDSDLKRFGDITGKPMEQLFNITRYVRYTGSDLSDILPYLEEHSALFVAGAAPSLSNELVKYCTLTGIRGFFMPPIGNVIVSGAEHIKSFSTPVLSVRRATPNAEYRFIKRAFDIFASLIGIIVLSPFMLITALLIKCYDGGPVFYRQVRLTRDGKEFRIIKFRSMRVDAEKDGVARLSTGDKDPRITPVGRFIRACRLDELPQLFNILCGDMSIVGPRPERPEIAQKYYETLPEFALRLQVKAGLTGYAQVYGKYNTNPYEKLEFDLLYINKMSILTDLELMFNTFRILFSKESTEGVDGELSGQAEKGFLGDEVILEIKDI